MKHCAQRGCEVPTENEGDKKCPVCNNPLILVEYGDDGRAVSQEKPKRGRRRGEDSDNTESEQE